MTLEYTMRARVVRALKPLHAISVENPCHPGTPDVNYAHGWIELKAMPEFPKRPDTPLRVPHYTPQQKIWAVKRSHAGGLCWLLIMVGREWFLLDGVVAARHLGESIREQLITLSDRYWSQTPTDKEILECFSNLQT